VTRPLTLALPKGRLLDPALALLATMGVQGLDADTRRLLLADERMDLRFILLKPADVPTYVEYGAADLGIVGKDILLEQEPDVYEPVDLGFGFCRLVVAEPRELWERDDPAKWSWVRVATKYPALTERYFSDRGIQVEIVRLDGSIELAPLVGLAERAAHRPGQISGGQAQRVAICRSLINKPRIVLADEPTGNLDRGNAESVLTALRSAAEDGCTVVIATHDPFVLDHADSEVRL